MVFGKSIHPLFFAWMAPIPDGQISSIDSTSPPSDWGISQPKSTSCLAGHLPWTHLQKVLSYIPPLFDQSPILFFSPKPNAYPQSFFREILRTQGLFTFLHSSTHLPFHPTPYPQPLRNIGGKYELRCKVGDMDSTKFWEWSWGSQWV